MPDKIWLHKDTKYNTGDVACGYQYEFAQGIEDEGGIENFVEYVPVGAFIEKATSYIQQHWIWNTKMIEDFKKYMKGE